MRLYRLSYVILVFVLSPMCLGEDEVPKGVPYNSLKTAMKLVKGTEIDGVKCSPFYLKPTEEGAILNVKEADFRIITKEGAEVPLKCVALSKIADDELTKADNSAIKDGYTHILWVPKSVEEYEDGTLMHSLPKGFLQIMASVVFTNKK